MYTIWNTQCQCISYKLNVKEEIKPMGKLIDLTGQKFGRLSVVREAEPRYNKKGEKIHYWFCECECGNKKDVEGKALREGSTVSCGCWRKEKARANLIGKTFAYLTVIKEVGVNEEGSVVWLCECVCGNKHEVTSKYLLNGEVTSCGCRRREILKKQSQSSKTHGMSDCRIYSIWRAMKDRCNNPNNKSYEIYGGKGVTVCEEWNVFENFYRWSIDNGYNNDLTIDRINSNGNYEPVNCRWVNRKIQGNNTSRNHCLTYKGETKTMSEWAEIFGIKYTTLRGRINNYHWTVEKALETPVRKSVN